MRLQRCEARPRIGEAVLQGLPKLGREQRRIPALISAEADAGKARPEILLRGVDGAERKQGVHQVEKCKRGLLLSGCQRCRKVDRRSSSRGWLAQKGRERLHLVARLNLLDSGEVSRVEELGAEQGAGEVSLALDHAAHACGRLATPAWPGDHEATAAVAGGARAEVGEVVRVECRSAGRSSSGSAPVAVW